jgi:mevalonate kinase
VDFNSLNDVRFNILVGDTGIEAKTKITVSQVNNLYKYEPKRYEKLFERYDKVYKEASKAIAMGDEKHVGMLMNENQKLLEQLDTINREVNEAADIYKQVVDIASHELRELAEAAVEAGAYGAKLSGGGGGGIMIALISPEVKNDVMNSMKEKAKALGLYNFKVYEALLGVEGVKIHNGI